MSAGSRDFWEGRYRDADARGESLWGTQPNGWIAATLARLGLVTEGARVAPRVGSGDGADARALDLGAGEGRNALWLASLGWHVAAVDFSATAVAGLRRRAEQAGLARLVEARVADAREPHDGDPVNLAILCYLQLEPDALAAAIARAAEAIAPGGVLVGIWHDRLDVERGLGGTMTPAIRTTPAETAGFARAAGLAVELSARRDRETTGGAASDCLLIARRASGT